MRCATFTLAPADIAGTPWSGARLRAGQTHVALRASSLQYVPVLQQLHTPKHQVERSIAVMPYQRQMLQLLIGHDVRVGEVPHIDDVGLGELIRPRQSIVADFKVADRPRA